MNAEGLEKIVDDLIIERATNPQSGDAYHDGQGSTLMVIDVRPEVGNGVGVVFFKIITGKTIKKGNRFLDGFRKMVTQAIRDGLTYTFAHCPQWETNLKTGGACG